MHNVLVTGSNGQLGSEIRNLVDGSMHSQAGAWERDSRHPAPRVKCKDDWGFTNFFFTDRETLDITSLHAMKAFISTNDIDTIINCAAYTAVDKAEEDEFNANEVNYLAVKYLAEIAKEKDIKLVHISTNYVFDGKNCRPYVEDDSVNPNGVYGKTKLYGEMALQEIAPKNSIIIRTSWVYSIFGANFVKTMLRLGKEKDELGVIFDQIGSPTYARDLAKMILEILPKIDNDKVEIYNYSNEGVLSWYDFAKEIMRMGKLECKINPIETKEYPTSSSRPHFSLLNKVKIKKKFNIEIPYWKDSLDECLKIIGERK